MRRHIYILLLASLVLGCRKDCSSRIDNMKIHSVVNSTNSEPSQIKGWYYSEFQNGAINLAMEFDHYGAGELCDYYWENYPEINSIKIYCNKDLYFNKDTLAAGETLNDLFEIQKFEADFHISFLLSEKVSSNINYTDKFYTFSASISTNKNESFTSSCIVKK